MGREAAVRKQKAIREELRKKKLTGVRKQRMGMSSEGSHFFSGDHAHAKGTTAKMEKGGYRPKGQC